MTYSTSAEQRALVISDRDVVLPLSHCKDISYTDKQPVLIHVCLLILTLEQTEKPWTNKENREIQ